MSGRDIEAGKEGGKAKQGASLVLRNIALVSRRTDPRRRLRGTVASVQKRRDSCCSTNPGKESPEDRASAARIQEHGAGSRSEAGALWRAMTQPATKREHQRRGVRVPPHCGPGAALPSGKWPPPLRRRPRAGTARRRPPVISGPTQARLAAHAAGRCQPLAGRRRRRALTPLRITTSAEK